MKVTPHIVLAGALVAALPVAFCRRSPEPIELPAGRQSAPGPGVLGDGLPDVVFLRGFAKDRLARAVIAGRRSPREAAALFRALDQLRPRPEELLPPPTENLDQPAAEERYGRQVLARVRGELSEEPRDHARAVLARVEAELWEGGAIRLPDPATLESAEELLAQVRDTLTEAERNALRRSEFLDRPASVTPGPIPSP
jgi:hypothetical protein